VNQLWEVPPKPLLEAHPICVDLLIQIIQQPNRLNDHGVNLTSKKKKKNEKMTSSFKNSHLITLSGENLSLYLDKEWDNPISEQDGVKVDLFKMVEFK